MSERGHDVRPDATVAVAGHREVVVAVAAVVVVAADRPNRGDGKQPSVLAHVVSSLLQVRDQERNVRSTPARRQVVAGGRRPAAGRLIARTAVIAARDVVEAFARAELADGVELLLRPWLMPTWFFACSMSAHAAGPHRRGRAGAADPEFAAPFTTIEMYGRARERGDVGLVAEPSFGVAPT